MKLAFWFVLMALNWLFLVAFHLYVTWIAYHVAGFWGTILTFCLPGLAELFWAFQAIRQGLGFLNPLPLGVAVGIVLSVACQVIGKQLNEA